MIYWDGIFTLSPFLLFWFFFFLAVVFYFIAYAALKLFSRQYKSDVQSIPIAAFLGTLSTMWALSIGFAAADIWAVNSAAAQASAEERSAITRLTGMAAPKVLNNPELMAALRDYAKTVRNHEWREHANTKPAPEVEQSLQALRLSLLNMANEDKPSVLLGQLVNDFDELQDARNKRLAYGNASVNSYKWNLVLSLTLITAIVIAVMHADRVSAGKKSLIIYLSTAAFCLWMLGIHVNPYRASQAVDTSFNLDELVDMQLGIKPMS